MFQTSQSKQKMKPITKPTSDQKAYFELKNIINNQIKDLEKIILDGSNWVDASNETDFAWIDPHNPDQEDDFYTIISYIKDNYIQTLEESPEMFGFIKFIRNTSLTNQ